GRGPRARTVVRNVHRNAEARVGGGAAHAALVLADDGHHVFAGGVELERDFSAGELAHGWRDRVHRADDGPAPLLGAFRPEGDGAALDILELEDFLRAADRGDWRIRAGPAALEEGAGWRLRRRREGRVRRDDEIAEDGLVAARCFRARRGLRAALD